MRESAGNVRSQSEDDLGTAIIGGRLDVRAYLSRTEVMDAADLVELLCADQVRRWQLGERVPAEAYLRLHPGLSEDSATAFELIYGEFALREQLGEKPSPAEYEWRFPQFAEKFRRQFSLHQALLADEPAAPADTADGRVTPPGLAEERPMGSGSWPAIPGYEILGELGRGGMAVVYKARQRALDRLVALKVIRAGLGPVIDEVARFRAEAAAVARLQHPNIIQIYEVGESGGQLYLALEHAAGGSLAQKLAAAPLRPPEAAAVLETLALAVQHAHEQGIIHRDLKPANVLFTAEGTAKIADFGLAKNVQVAVGQTQTGVILGTPSYMAPEQARGEVRAITPGVDVYALGAVLYEMLTGRPPFQGTTPLSILEQVTHLDPVPPTRLQPHLPRDLETICLKCLEKDSCKRYAGARDLADDVRRFREGRPIVARPVGALERAWRWCRRNPVVAALLALLLVVFLGGFAGVLWKWRDAERAQKRAEDTAEQMRVGQERLNAANILVQTAREYYTDRGRWPEAAVDFDRARQLRPDHSFILNQRGLFYCCLGLWDEAAPDFDRAYHAHLAEEEPNPTRHELFPWYNYACLRLLAGDVSGYRKVCAAMLPAYRQANDRLTAGFWGGYALTLAPQAVDDSDEPIRLAREALAGKPMSSTYFLLGAAHSRAGQFPEAVRRLREALADPDKWEAEPTVRLALAMAQHHLGQKEEARRALTGIEQWLEEAVKRAQGSGGFSLPMPKWQNWAAFQIWYREAGALIRGEPVPDPPQFHVVRALAFTLLKRPELAAREYELAGQRPPKKPKPKRPKS